jgi:hypothetical protein
MTTVGDLSSSHDSPIERWITEYSIPTRLENYIAELDQTQLLTEMLAGQVIRRDIIINFNEDIARAFTEMNPDNVVRIGSFAAARRFVSKVARPGRRGCSQRPLGVCKMGIRWFELWKTRPITYST